MSKKIKKYIIIGNGNECPKCKNPMERRAHREIPKTETYYFTEWDYCRNCKHIQLYEEFKSIPTIEEEIERQNLFMKSI